mmetsp:Transcript_3031/g.4502  ORF Transcript_3031/g.4502 Transcript_3031/m.4502 type:complete len:1938 (+) Transcript_3031:29-5842(+)
MVSKLFEWKLVDKAQDKKRLMILFTARELALLCAPISMELYLDQGPDEFLRSFLAIRKGAVQKGIEVQADHYLGKLLVNNFYRNVSEQFLKFTIQVVLKVCAEFPQFVSYILPEISAKFGVASNETIIAGCYLILRVSGQCSSSIPVERRLLTLVNVIKRAFSPSGVNTNARAAALRVVRHLLTTTEGNDLAWPVAMSLPRAIDKKNIHPILQPVIDDVQFRLRGISALLQGMGTSNRLCPAYGVSLGGALKRIFTSRRTADYRTLVYMFCNGLADRAPISMYLPETLGSSSVLPANQRRDTVCKAFVQRLVALIWLSMARVPWEAWQLLAGQLHALIDYNVIKFDQFVEKLYAHFSHGSKSTAGLSLNGRYSDNRIVWLFAQCMTLEPVKTVLTKARSNGDKSLIEKMESFYNPNASINIKSGQGVDGLMKRICDLSIKGLLYRIHYIEKNINTLEKFKFTGPAKNIKHPAEIVDWWSKGGGSEFHRLRINELANIGLLSIMSSREVASRITKYLTATMPTSTLMPGQLIVNARVDPLPRHLLAVLSEGTKKHLQRELSHALRDAAMASTNSTPSPALVLTYSRLLRVTPLFGKDFTNLFMYDVKAKPSNSHDEIAVGGHIGVQRLRHIMLEMLAFPLFRATSHNGGLVRMFQVLGKMIRKPAHPQVAITMQHLMVQMASSIIHIPISPRISKHRKRESKDSSEEAKKKLLSETFGHLVDRELVLSLARAISLSPSRARPHIDANPSVPYSSLLPNSSSSRSQKELPSSNNENSKVKESTKPTAEEKPSVSKSSGRANRFGLTAGAIKTEQFLHWFHTLPHSRRSWSRNTLRYFPAFIRERLIPSEVAYARNAENKAKNNPFFSWENAVKHEKSPILRSLVSAKVYQPLQESEYKKAQQYYSADPIARRGFLAGVAVHWIKLAEDNHASRFRTSGVKFILQQFSITDTQDAAVALIDTALEYIYRAHNKEVGEVRRKLIQEMLWTMAESIIPFSQILMLLADADSHPSGAGLDLALNLVLETKNGGIIARRNKVVELLKSVADGTTPGGGPAPGGGLRFRSHLGYHQFFKKEIPSLYNSRGMRVRSVLPIYYSSIAAMVVPGICCLIMRLLEHDRVKDVREVINATWPLIRLFHPSPVMLVYTLMTYYDRSPVLDRATRLDLLRFLSHPAGEMGGHEPGGNLPKTWIATFQFLNSVHFSNENRRMVWNAGSYPKGAEKVKEGKTTIEEFSNGIDGKGMGEEWLNFFAADDEKPIEETKTEENEELAEEFEDKDRILGPNAKPETEQRRYLSYLAERIAELLPAQGSAAMRRPAQLRTPSCGPEKEFASPLERGLTFGAIEILAQMDTKSDPYHRNLARLIAETFVTNEIDSYHTHSQNPDAKNATPGPVDGAAILITRLPVSLHMSLIDLFVELLLPPIIFDRLHCSKIKNAAYEGNTEESPSVPSQLFQMSPQFAAKYLRSSRKKRQALRDRRSRRNKRPRWMTESSTTKRPTVKSSEWDVSIGDYSISTLNGTFAAASSNSKQSVAVPKEEKMEVEEATLALPSLLATASSSSLFIAEDMKFLKKMNFDLWVGVDNMELVKPMFTPTVVKEAPLPSIDNLFKSPLGSLSGGLFPKNHSEQDTTKSKAIFSMSNMMSPQLSTLSTSDSILSGVPSPIPVPSPVMTSPGMSKLPTVPRVSSSSTSSSNNPFMNMTLMSQLSSQIPSDSYPTTLTNNFNPLTPTSSFLSTTGKSSSSSPRVPAQTHILPQAPPTNQHSVNSAPPNSSMKDGSLFRLPEPNTQLGRLLTLLEGCFSWAPGHFFAYFCERLTQRLRMHTNFEPIHNLSMIQLSHVLPAFQILAVGTTYSKSDVGVQEAVMRCVLYLLRVTSALTPPEIADDALARLRVVFDFIAYLQTLGGKFISVATRRELKSLGRSLHPSWREAFLRCTGVSSSNSK